MMTGVTDDLPHDEMHLTVHVSEMMIRACPGCHSEHHYQSGHEYDHSTDLRQKLLEYGL